MRIRASSANPSICAVLGHDCADLVGRTLFSFIHPDDLKEAQERLATRLKGGTARCEWRFRRAEGTYRWFALSVSPVGEPDGRVSGALVFTADVSDRRLVEAVLLQRNAQLEMLALGGRVLLATENPAAFLTDVFPRLQALLDLDLYLYYEIGADRSHLELVSMQGLSSDARQTMPPLTFDEDVVREAVWADGVPVPAAGGEPAARARDPHAGLIAAQGPRAYASQPLIARGEVLGILCFGSVRRPSFDKITLSFIRTFSALIAVALERSRIEQALRDSEQRFRVLVETWAQIVWEADRDGCMIKGQPNWRAYTGQTEQQWHDGGWLDTVHPEDRDYAQRSWQTAVAARTVMNAEYRLSTAEQGWRWTNVRAAPIQAADGMLRKWVGMNIDISARKAAEEALREADRRKDEFLATLAHELRNPLAPIRTGLDLLKLANLPRPNEQHACEMMDRQLSNLIRLVDDLLDASRITTGKLELRRERIDLGAVIDMAVETVAPVIQRAGHTLVVERPDSPIELDADPVRLSQVIANLLSNSAKYTRAGGHIRLVVRHSASDAVEICVEDDGTGIPEDVLPYVFKMFAQAERARERASGGLGIGLALVKGLVEMHGGTVTARNRAERGCVFTVVLPDHTLHAQTAGARLHPAVEEAPVRLPAARRVLVVDDNIDAAEAIAALLETCGHDVHQVHNGLAAIEAARHLGPDLILLDVGMPHVNGLEAARRIRNLHLERRPVIIAPTGWGQTADREATQNAGMDAHLVKPVDFSTLMSLLDRIA
jgi:PAS domain S-box-containing protein